VAYQSLREVYRQFEKIWSNSRMIRSPEELDAAIQANEMHYEDVNQEWLGALDRGWVYGDNELPFHDERVNRRYRKNIET
jgi:hypothetical protein